MSKRSATELQSASTADSHERKRHARGSTLEKLPENEIGEFEDHWEDEYESDEEVVDAAEKDGEDGMYVSLPSSFTIQT